MKCVDMETDTFAILSHELNTVPGRPGLLCNSFAPGQ